MANLLNKKDSPLQSRKRLETYNKQCIKKYIEKAMM